MVETVVNKLPRPNLYHIHKRWLYKHIGIALTLGIGLGLSYKIFVGDVYVRKVEEFYKTYDPYKDFERMRKLGVFTSCPPDDDD